MDLLSVLAACFDRAWPAACQFRSVAMSSKGQTIRDGLIQAGRQRSVPFFDPHSGPKLRFIDEANALDISYAIYNMIDRCEYEQNSIKVLASDPVLLIVQAERNAG